LKKNTNKKMKKIFFTITVILISAATILAINPKLLRFFTRPAEGQKAPALIYKNTEDKIMALSELKGKIVMIDFWASWCGPCRRVNPQVVALYKKYHGKKFNGGSDFEIYSVSLDQNKTAWMNAIKADGLAWPYHVCDFGGWNSEAAAKYGVNSIPRAFLIDGEGNIIGSNVHVEDIEAELARRAK
jgi:thiol-disulfide isomerase/thioredoxin